MASKQTITQPKYDRRYWFIVVDREIEWAAS